MEPYRSYQLQSKDVPLITFTVYRDTQQVAQGVTEKVYSIRIQDIHQDAAALFPKDLQQPVTDKALLHWIQRRKVPKNRHFVHSILNSITDDENPLRYADITYALSVNDAYWIVPQDMPQHWRDCNLYEHPFDERLAMVAFTGYSRKISGIVSTPETTASGALKKCWRRQGDGIYLIKGDPFPRSDGRNEAVMEYYASQVADVLGVEHVPYELAWFTHRSGEKEVVCSCPLFTSSTESYVNAQTYFRAKGWDIEHLDLASAQNQLNLASVYGAEAYGDMMVFDSLVCNQDRHLGNFGYLVNADTGEFLRPAPIFDNGRSLLYGAAASDLKNIPRYMEESGRYGAMMEFDKAAKLFVERRHLAGLRKLAAFTFTRHPDCQVIAADTMKLLDGFIQNRAKRLLSLYHEKHHVKVIRRSPQSRQDRSR